jgi:hypothetical protein
MKREYYWLLNVTFGAILAVLCGAIILTTIAVLGLCSTH